MWFGPAIAAVASVLAANHDSMTSPRFVISMLALDGLAMSKKCIESILASDCRDFVLHLTDNGSTDGTGEYFRDMENWSDNICQPKERLSIIRVVSNEENEGFIDPNNKAFEYARSVGAEFFITVNNDLTVPRNWLTVFAAMFDANPKLAVSGPKGTISRVDNAMVGNSADRYEFAEGSCMCVRVSAVEKNETLFAPYLKFIYYDDLELSLRMQRKGLEVRQANFHVVHRNGSTCTRHPDAVAKCRAAMTHNQAVMLKKWVHWNKVRKFDFPILFRRTFAAGDILQMTPIIRAMKKKWPLCPIDVECGVPEIFKGNPYVRRAGKQIPVTRETWVIDLNGSYEKTPQRHVMETYAEYAGLDYSEIEPKCELFLDGSLPVLQPKTVAVHIGPSNWLGRTWPMDRWQEVIRQLKNDGWWVVLFGDKSPIKFEAQLDLRGQSGVHELARLIRACELYVGLDSFPMHVAQAVGVPVVALFGIIDPKCHITPSGEYIAVTSDPNHPHTGKRNKIPNITFIRTDDSVMRTISVDMVMEAVRTMTQKAITA